jgi:hypothetical protein
MSDEQIEPTPVEDEPSEFELQRGRWRDLAEKCLQILHRTTAIERLLVEKELLKAEEIRERELRIANETLQAANDAIQAEEEEALLRSLESSSALPRQRRGASCQHRRLLS